MQINNTSFLLIILIFLFGFTLPDIVYGDDPPVIINRSYEVHEIDGRKYHFHAVLRGQTLYSIARAYGVSVEEIKAENPELEFGLRYDQMIRIPYVEKPVDTERDGFIEHRVRRRETLFGISRQYDVLMEDILQHNPEARKGLKVNQVLRIPVEPVEEEPEHKTYKVSEGDTFYSLSRKFNVSIEDINEINPGLEGVLKAGQVIKLPCYARPEPPEPFGEPEEIEETEITERDYAYMEFTEWHEIELWDEDYCRSPVLKEQYDVALLIPLFLEDADDYYEKGARLPEHHRSFTFIEFYEGILIALDSVEQMGANITLHVHDVCQDTTKALSVVDSPGFEEMDLIIGSFFPETLMIVAEFAAKHGIPVVSPLLQARKQLGFHSNIFQFTPSLSAQLNDLAEYVSYKYPTQNIILVHNDQPHVVRIINEFGDNLNKQIGGKLFHEDSLNLARVDGYYFDGALIGGRTTNVYVFNDTLLRYFQPPAERRVKYGRDEVLYQYFHRQNIKEVILERDSIEGLREKLSENKTNVLISLFGGEPAVSNYIRELSLLADTFDISVFAVPQWKNYKSLETDNLQTANVHIFTSESIDYSDGNVRDFVLGYRERFKSEPGSYAFKGVETGFYFMNALMVYGKDFYKCIYLLNRQGGYNSVRFAKTAGKDNGWENMRTHILKYDNYRIIDVRKPALVDK